MAMARLFLFVMVIGACVAVAHWLKARREDEKKRELWRQHEPLRLTQDGAWAVISARAGEPPKNAGLRVWMGLVIFIAALCCLGGAETAVVGLAVFLGGAFFWAIGAASLRSKNRIAFPQDGPFAVKSDAVRPATGAIIPAASVYRVLIENRVDGQIVSAGSSALFVAPITGGAAGATAIGAMAAGAGVVGLVGAIGDATRTAWQKKLHAIGYAVVAEHAGTRTVLASGLTSELAYAVYHETTTRLDGFRR
jgi:hypothetical protein